MEASDVKYWRVQILNTIILIRSPWGWVGEGIGLNAKSTPRQFQKMQNCRLILTWQLRPEPSSGRRPWRWPRSPSWSPAPSGRSSGWLLRQASPAFPWSYSRWKLGSALSSDPGSVWIKNLSKQELHLPLLSVRLLQSPVLLIRRRELVRREIVKAFHLSRIKAWWSRNLHQNLLQDIWVCDRQPGCRHVVESVDLAIHPVSLHVKLREIDLNNHYWTFWEAVVCRAGPLKVLTQYIWTALDAESFFTWWRFHGPLPKRRVGGITAGTPHFSTCMENGCKQSVGRMILLVSATNMCHKLSVWLRGRLGWNAIQPNSIWGAYFLTCP